MVVEPTLEQLLSVEPRATSIVDLSPWLKPRHRYLLIVVLTRPLSDNRLGLDRLRQLDVRIIDHIASPGQLLNTLRNLAQYRPVLPLNRGCVVDHPDDLMRATLSRLHHVNNPSRIHFV